MAGMCHSKHIPELVRLFGASSDTKAGLFKAPHEHTLDHFNSALHITHYSGYSG